MFGCSVKNKAEGYSVKNIFFTRKFVLDCTNSQAVKGAWLYNEYCADCT